MILSLVHYAWRTMTRHKLRSALTIGGIATAMFLFCFIEGLQNGVRQATENEATQNVLIVYQKSRFCPATSLLPERYVPAIQRIDGVKSVVPVKVYVNNCRASLDTVTFLGVPPELVNTIKKIDLKSGSLGDFTGRRDAAIVGESLAARRGLKPGDRFQIGGFSVGIAGVFKSDTPGEDNVAFTHLEMLQRGKAVDSLGYVTQFEVAIDDPAKADAISEKIDEMFKSETVQTTTKSHKAFIASSTGDLMGMIRFTRFLGLLCVVLVLALTANTVFVMVQERVREHAVLQTIGFAGRHLFSMIIVESLLLALAGGIIGTAAAAAALHFGHFNLSAEGVNISFAFTPLVVAAGMAASAITGLLAGFVPALQASLISITEALRRS
ncbi:ABC transporter substrate-binding protein [candidate division BRC1 bacterium HGW-BRC1-1]|jgi:putative ABC transport system permease protein|nr:MAG: ABC transporter substrate-binding protein [candidate division BRC1 bacterium HGW-BRC1-1]